VNESIPNIDSRTMPRVPFEVSVRVADRAHYVGVTTRDLSLIGLSFISPIAMKGRIKLLMGNLYNGHSVDAEVAFCRRHDVTGIGQYLVGCQFVDRHAETQDGKVMAQNACMPLTESSAQTDLAIAPWAD